MVADRLHLAAPGGSGDGSGNSSRAVEVVFGCENVETGEIYRQRVDGVMGMGNNVNSLPQQVSAVGSDLQANSDVRAAAEAAQQWGELCEQRQLVYRPACAAHSAVLMRLCLLASRPLYVGHDGGSSVDA